MRRIAVETGRALRGPAGDTLRLSLTLRNPYPYDYRFDGDSVKVGIVWRNLSETTRRYDLPEVQGLLPAGGTLRREARFVVPRIAGAHVAGRLHRVQHSGDDLVQRADGTG